MTGTPGTKRRNRKGSDEDILRLNALGISLVSISQIIGCHPTAITLRLKNLGVPPTDTRRSFMEDIYAGMSVAQQEWLADQLSPADTIKDYLRRLLAKEFNRGTHGS